MRRSLPLVVAVFTALLLQSTVFPQLTLVGAKPELVYMIVILVGMLEGPAAGASVGFGGGMAQDFLQNAPKGITALTLTRLGYSVGLIRTYIISPSPFLPMILVGIGTFGGLIFYGTVSALIGQLDVSALYLIRVSFFSGLYNALLTPLAYPVMRRISDGARTPSMFR
ncbi:MAG: rod shape-determining protein MreD [Actinobacteria bacterium]|nr:rod shape-determining protein MreD [Actinomycetota bacterium]